MEKLAELTELRSTASDEELMQQYAQGDLEAFSELFNRHKQSVYAFIRRFVRADEMMDDLFQNIFLRLIRSRSRYRPTAKFTTWLFTITRSVCIDALRKRKSAEVIPLFPHQENNPVEMEEFAQVQNLSTPREESYHLELQDRLEEIIQTLPEVQREVLLLREKTDLTFEDIGRVVGCSTNTAKSRMHYALLTLRQKLTEQGIHP